MCFVTFILNYPDIWEYAGLFFASFLAATVVPFSSEAILAAMLLGNYHPVSCVLIASTGNWLGGMSGYYLGYLGKWEWLEKYFRFDRAKLDDWNVRLSKYGYFLAFLCWLPSIGDFIAVGLGFIRSNVYLVSLIMFLGKFLRYVVVAYLMITGKSLF
ncbi:MAG: DedA family protein [Sphingobacteriales bacterium]|nr:MAG: DedA family protein [Sphingobacteriales bacterium]